MCVSVCMHEKERETKRKYVHVKVTLCTKQIFSMTYVDELNSVNL